MITEIKLTIDEIDEILDWEFVVEQEFGPARGRYNPTNMLIRKLEAMKAQLLSSPTEATARQRSKN